MFGMNISINIGGFIGIRYGLIMSFFPPNAFIEEFEISRYRASDISDTSDIE